MCCGATRTSWTGPCGWPARSTGSSATRSATVAGSTPISVAWSPPRAAVAVRRNREEAADDQTTGQIPADDRADRDPCRGRLRVDLADHAWPWGQAHHGLPDRGGRALPRLR